jgi:predicted nucleic acid-binding protein
MIVADANLIAYLLLPGQRTKEAEDVFAKDSVWAVPVLCRSELRSVLLQYVRAGDLPLADAIRTMLRGEGLLAGREADIDSRRVLELAAGSRCSSYDCEYVALAEVLRVPLVTNDGPVLKAFPAIALSPRAFLESVAGAG